MALPRVAIIGAPNTGKSTLFNALLHRRLAITTPTPGTTIDRLSGMVFYNNFLLELIDTAGLTFNNKIPAQGYPTHLSQAIQQQIDKALTQADLVLFVTDIRQGVTSLEKDIANFIRKKNKEIILLVNKADTPKFDERKNEFYALGFGEPFLISALQRRNLDELLHHITQRLEKLGFKPKEIDLHEKTPIKIAIVGKRNVGKSTLVNTLAKEERVIVSEIPGTTRDAVDVQIKIDDENFIVIDTAGIRRKRTLREAIDFFSWTRMEAAIKRSDVVLFLIDAQQKISYLDKKVGDLIIKYEKPCVITINKWDLVEKEVSPADYLEYISHHLKGLKYAPLSFISAKTGFNLTETIKLLKELYQQANLKVPTSLVNRILQKIQHDYLLSKCKLKNGQTNQTSVNLKGVPKMYYATQTGTNPPRFTIFVNNPQLFSSTYRRYLVNQFREELPFSEVPIRIELRPRKPL